MLKELVEQNYRVSYDVIDEFPKNRYFFEVRSKNVGEALHTESVNEKEVFNAVVTNMRGYHEVPDEVLPQLQEVLDKMPVWFVFAPELITEVRRLMKSTIRLISRKRMRDRANRR